MYINYLLLHHKLPQAYWLEMMHYFIVSVIRNSIIALLDPLLRVQSRLQSIKVLSGFICFWILGSSSRHIGLLTELSYLWL